MSNNKLTFSRAVIFLQIGLVFLFGGLLQTVGVISKTKLTILLAFLSIFYCFMLACFRSRLPKPVVLLIAAITVMIMIFSCLASNCALVNSLGSLLVIIIPLSFYLSTTQFIRSWFLTGLMKFFLLLSVVQLPVMLLQKAFYHQIAALSSESVFPIDIAFGTFYFKDDHALGFLLLCLLFFTLFNENSSFIVHHKLWFLVWWTLTIFVANSKLSIVLWATIIAGFSVQKFFLFFRYKLFKKKNYTVTLFLLLILVAGTVITINTGLLRNERLDAEYNRVESLIARERPVPRYGPLIKFLRSPVTLLGEGAFSYHNPITKEWGIRGGHSQWYTNYYDFGILGLILPIFMFLVMAFKIGNLPTEWPWYFFMLMAFGLVTECMLDPAILTTFFVFLHTGGYLPNHPLRTRPQCGNASQPVTGGVG